PGPARPGQVRAACRSRAAGFGKPIAMQPIVRTGKPTCRSRDRQSMPPHARATSRRQPATHRRPTPPRMRAHACTFEPETGGARYAASKPTASRARDETCLHAIAAERADIRRAFSGSPAAFHQMASNASDIFNGSIR
ncbi:hypothetical protein OIV70_24335, partial [Burkholderia pseudomallei]|nr:hypothetical protein [Burkholderia pseudomallei]